MSYNIEEIEGIGPSYGEKLKAAGIKTTEKLLETAGTKKGRQTLAEDTGISEKLILTWVNHSDLMRIKGIGGQFAELLEAAGVDTVKELRHRNAENLEAKLDEVNEQKNLNKGNTGVAQIQGWIDQAKELDPAVFH